MRCHHHIQKGSHSIALGNNKYTLHREVDTSTQSTSVSVFGTCENRYGELQTEPLKIRELGEKWACGLMDGESMPPEINKLNG